MPKQKDGEYLLYLIDIRAIASTYIYIYINEKK